MALLVQNDRRCQGYNTEPGVIYHAHDLPRCTANGVKKVRGKWVCAEHAEQLRAASKDLVVLEPGRCPRCGSSTEREVTTEQPLLRHGGYGAARRTITEYCSTLGCRWWLTSDVSEERPERVAELGFGRDDSKSQKRSSDG